MRTFFLNISLKVCVAAAMAALVMASTGCENTDLGAVDAELTAPFLTTAAVTPSSVNIDTLGAVGGRYSVHMEPSVLVSDPDGAGDLEEVYVEVIRPSAEAPFLKAPLGLAGAGSTPPWSLFSGTVQFSLSRDEAGRYRVRFVARDKSGLYGNVLETTLHVRRNNARPHLSNLSAPDTIVLPVGGSLLVPLSVAASDSDGLADIRQVYFRSLTSTSPDFKFFLLDDGGTSTPGPPFFISSGDAVAGDGRYSVQVPLSDSPTVRRTNIFAFQAVDSFGDTSSTVLHTLTVR